MRNILSKLFGGGEASQNFLKFTLILPLSLRQSNLDGFECTRFLPYDLIRDPVDDIFLTGKTCARFPTLAAGNNILISS